MKILLTAGGTTEKIDEVRGITNHSSGRLGVAIASELLTHDARIDYVTTTSALLPPENPQISQHLIDSTQELATTMATLLQEKHYDAVIHSMAVSDFTPTSSVSQEQFLKALNSQLEQLPEKQLTQENFKDLLLQLSDHTVATTKISSNTEHLVVILEQTPKVIQQIKQLQPETLLIGFKLLVDVSQEELFAVAKKNLTSNQADYILANDLTSITATKHLGYLIDKDGVVASGQTKQEIAQIIVQTISEQIGAVS
ncbi:MAG: phosphopantothenate--cysteine ligase [Enterococcus sp.]